MKYYITQAGQEFVTEAKKTGAIHAREAAARLRSRIMSQAQGGSKEQLAQASKSSADKADAAHAKILKRTP